MNSYDSFDMRDVSGFDDIITLSENELKLFEVM